MIYFLTNRVFRALVLVVAIMALNGFATNGIAQTISSGLKKKITHSEKKNSDKKPPVIHSIKCVLEKVDLRDHPMTLDAMGWTMAHRKVVFTGNLSPQTVVFASGKSVGVKSLKKGKKVIVFYQKNSKRLLVVKVRILSSRQVSKQHH
ncbi:MAG: hypothetical protein ACYCVG_08780 [Leptospirillum sp.]